MDVGVAGIGAMFPSVVGRMLIEGCNVICVPMGTVAGGDCRMKFCTAPVLFIGIGMIGWFFAVTSVTMTVISGVITGVAVCAGGVAITDVVGVVVTGGAVRVWPDGNVRETIFADRIKGCAVIPSGNGFIAGGVNIGLRGAGIFVSGEILPFAIGCRIDWGRTDFTACNSVLIRFPSLFCAMIVVCAAVFAPIISGRMFSVCSGMGVGMIGTSFTVWPAARGGSCVIGADFVIAPDG